MGMNTMNLVTTTPTTPIGDLTTVGAQEVQDWFAEAGLAVTEVAHCDTASCPVCFGHDSSETAQAA
jgi:hypothetical protein